MMCDGRKLTDYIDYTYNILETRQFTDNGYTYVDILLKQTYLQLRIKGMEVKRERKENPRLGSVENRTSRGRSHGKTIVCKELNCVKLV